MRVMVDNGIYDKLASKILIELEQFKVPCMQIAIVDDGGIRWQQSFGYQKIEQNRSSSADTVFRVGSISKLFTATAIMQLHERKIIDINTPITTYCSRLTFVDPFNSRTPITLRHLLSHRSGIIRESPVGNYFDNNEPTITETVESIINTELVYEVGSKSKYSNLGPTIAGFILEQVTGQSFPDYVEENILIPLEMHSSSFLMDSDSIKHNLASAYMVDFDGNLFPAPLFQLGTLPAGNMYSTANDLANFMVCIFHKGLFKNRRILETKTVQEMLSEQFIQPETSTTRNFGLGFALGKYKSHQNFSHTGIVYGYSSEFFALKEPEIGIITLHTVDGSLGVNEKIRNMILEALLPDEPMKTITSLHPFSEKTWNHSPNSIGKYYSNLCEAWFWKEESQYFLHSMGTTKRLSAIAANTFIMNDRMGYGQIVQFEEDTENLKVGPLVYHKVPKYIPNWSIPAEYLPFIGDYGNDFNVLRVFVKDTALRCIIEWFYEYPLIRISDTIFAFPDYGLYEGEQIQFITDADGVVTEAVAGFVHFNKRK